MPPYTDSQMVIQELTRKEKQVPMEMSIKKKKNKQTVTMEIK